MYRWIELRYFLVEELGNFLGVQWAAVTDFAQSRVLDNLANLGSSDIFKFGGDREDFAVEKGQDFVLVGDGTSSHVTDETSVALSGFRVGQDSECGILVTFSRPLSSAGSNGSQKETLEEDNSSKESKWGNAGRAKGDNSASGSSNSAKNNSGVSNAGHGHDSKSSNKHRVHAKNKNEIFIFKFKFKSKFKSKIKK
jgi:hypothetical protein